jgi:hypothetical protein
MVQGRVAHTVTLLPNGQVLVAGGFDLSDGVRYLATAEIYDPATGTWSPTGSMADPRSGHGATLLSDGIVLVEGGSNLSTLATAELYDPASGTWVRASRMNSRFLHHDLVSAKDFPPLQRFGSGCHTMADQVDARDLDRADTIIDAEGGRGANLTFNIFAGSLRDPLSEIAEAVRNPFFSVEN